MTSQNTPRLNLPLIVANQAQKHLTVNEGLMRLESLVQASAISKTLSAEPNNPVDGDSYILTTAPTGSAWSSIPALSFVRFESATWEVVDMPIGAIVYIATEGGFVVKTSSNWVLLDKLIKNLDNISKLGIGTFADDYNQLSLKSAAALLSAKYSGEGGSGNFSLALNKQANTNSAQVLWQNNFVSKIIFGLLGNDNFSLKASANSSDWFEALSLNHRSGRLKFSAKPYVLPDAHKRRHVETLNWLPSTTPVDNSWRGICCAPELGLLVCIASTGTNNRVMTSYDGINWTSRVTPADNDWTQVVWAEALSLFIAVAETGTGNRVMTSPDGVNWTTRSSAANNAWQAITYARELGLLVCVASSGVGNRVMTSTDGINWAIGANIPDLNWTCVTWASELGLFVAAASSGTGSRIMTSQDGINWSLQTTPFDNNWQAICYAPELQRLVCVANTGVGNRVMTSNDGLNWSVSSSASDIAWEDVCYSAELGLFVAVADSGAGHRLMTSHDGLSWILGTSASDNNWSCVTWCEPLGLFVAAASSGVGNRIMTSVSAHSLIYRS